MLFVLACVLGALARYTIMWGLLQINPQALIWGVFIVNIVGCFGFGFLWPIVHARKILLVGFMGSFTTFSSYIYEMYIFIQDGAWLLIFTNSLLQIGLGLLALRLGLYVHARRNCK